MKSEYFADADAVLADADNGLKHRKPFAKHYILVAEDDAELRDSMTHVLSDEYQVQSVGNGLEALVALYDQHFDIIICAIRMPELDGFELVSAVRSTLAFAGIPIILLSASAGDESAAQGVLSGPIDYLTKPFSGDVLRSRVQFQLQASNIRKAASENLNASEERFRVLAASIPNIIFECNTDGKIIYINDAFASYTGVENTYCNSWKKVIYPDDIPCLLEWRRNQAPFGNIFREQIRIRRSDGTYRRNLILCVPQRNLEGGVLRWTGTCTDIHDQYLASIERDFLSSAGQILAQTLDLHRILKDVAELCVPQFAEWCQIDLVTSEGEIQTYALAHHDATKQQLARTLIGTQYLNLMAEAGAPYVIRKGHSFLMNDFPDHLILEMVENYAEYTTYQQLGISSVVSVPLIAKGQTLGAITLVYGNSRRRYATEDLILLEELGRRTGIAVFHARQFERERHVAESFQEASLPMSLPKVDGFSFDAVYIPGSNDMQVGGDWYDAVRLLDGRIVISIGDVTGNGLRAAVTMGNMRQIIRGIAQVHADPALMLDAADRALRIEYPDQIATAFVGVVDPITRIFSYASAGHPPPLLRYADGKTRWLFTEGLPLGLRNGSDADAAANLLIPQGTHIVLYTDGLTEYERRPIDGEIRLQQIIEKGDIFSSKMPADSLRKKFFDGHLGTDDVAILVVSMNELIYSEQGQPKRIESWTFDALDAEAGQATRKAFAESLRKRGIPIRRSSAAELVFGELIGNVARYAPCEVEIIVDWSGSAPVLHVLDHGIGFHYIPSLPNDIYSESGRGLYISSLLSEGFHVAKRPSGGSHARAVLSKSL